MWFDKDSPDVLFSDIREEDMELCDGRRLTIKPDVIADFRNLPFEDGRFSLVAFDPPHMKELGHSSWMYAKYGCLGMDWKNDLRRGFDECFRVLRDRGVLVFKWNEAQIAVGYLLSLIPYKPLFGHRTSNSGKTIWLCFIK